MTHLQIQGGGYESVPPFSGKIAVDQQCEETIILWKSCFVQYFKSSLLQS